MKRMAVALDADATDRQLVKTLERTCVAAGLRVSMRATLLAFPGSVHWHFKKGHQRGVLELTYWPARRRAWFSIHADRRAPWITPTVAAIRRSLI
jgi:hypothetical protein